MATPVTLIPGDGIGPDITDAAVRVLEAAGAALEWDRQLAGMAAVKACNDPMPESTLASIERTRLALKGPLETPVGGGYRSVNVALRKTFDLYANVRPARSIVPGGRFEKTGPATGRGLLRVALIDGRMRRVRWIGDIPSDPADKLSPAVAASIASHFADLVVAP